MTDDAKPTEHGDRKNYEIHVNRKPFPWHDQFITGAQILGLVNETVNDYTAYVKVPKGEDIPVGADERVDLEDSKNRDFITIPNRSTEG